MKLAVCPIREVWTFLRPQAMQSTYAHLFTRAYSTRKPAQPEGFDTGGNLVRYSKKSLRNQQKSARRNQKSEIKQYWKKSGEISAPKSEIKEKPQERHVCAHVMTSLNEFFPVPPRFSSFLISPQPTGEVSVTEAATDLSVDDSPQIPPQFERFGRFWHAVRGECSGAT